MGLWFDEPRHSMKLHFMVQGFVVLQLAWTLCVLCSWTITHTMIWCYCYWLCFKCFQLQISWSHCWSLDAPLQGFSSVRELQTNSISSEALQALQLQPWYFKRMFQLWFLVGPLEPNPWSCLDIHAMKRNLVKTRLWIHYWWLFAKPLSRFQLHSKDLHNKPFVESWTNLVKSRQRLQTCYRWRVLCSKDWTSFLLLCLHCSQMHEPFMQRILLRLNSPRHWFQCLHLPRNLESFKVS